MIEVACKESRGILTERRKSEDSSPKKRIALAGIHFGDPCAPTAHSDGGVYYECLSDDNFAARARRHRGHENCPPIRQLMNLEGWCPVSSLLLHVSTTKRKKIHFEIPDNALFISICGIDKLLPEEDWKTPLNGWNDRRYWPKASQTVENCLTELQIDALVEKLWGEGHVVIRRPERWRLTPAEDYGSIFFRMPKRVSPFNITEAEKTIEGVKFQYLPGSNQDRAILDYETKMIARCFEADILDKDKKGVKGDTKYELGRKLLECLYSGLGSISVSDLLNSKDKGENDYERFVYYTVPGSSKGGTTAGYIVATAPLPASVANGLLDMLLSVGFYALDALTTLRTLFVERIAKESKAQHKFEGSPPDIGAPFDRSSNPNEASDQVATGEATAADIAAATDRSERTATASADTPTAADNVERTTITSTNVATTTDIMECTYQVRNGFRRHN